jgi:hypothetical protein
MAIPGGVDLLGMDVNGSTSAQVIAVQCVLSRKAGNGSCPLPRKSSIHSEGRKRNLKHVKDSRTPVPTSSIAESSPLEDPETRFEEGNHLSPASHVAHFPLSLIGP